MSVRAAKFAAVLMLGLVGCSSSESGDTNTGGTLSTGGATTGGTATTGGVSAGGPTAGGAGIGELAGTGGAATGGAGFGGSGSVTGSGSTGAVAVGGTVAAGGTGGVAAGTGGGDTGGAGTGSTGGASTGGAGSGGGTPDRAGGSGGSSPGGTGGALGGVGGSSAGSGGVGDSSAGSGGVESGTGGDNAAGAPFTGGSGGSAVGDELPGSACTREFDVPSFQQLEANAKMPEPSTFLDGTKVQTKEDWICRQKEISQLAQAFIYGPKPGKPETLEATFSNGTLTLDMANEGRTWKLTVNIKTPSGEGPFPAMFDVDAGAPSGVASIGVGLTWLTSNVASAGNGRGTSGKFYDFFPDSEKTGSLMAWAWVASRIVDGLIATTGHKIDVSKMYGLGCSRNGKTSATMALFDQRIAMVGMLSPGSGTTSGWRIAEAQTSSVQTAGEIYGETTWMGEDFGQFGNDVNKLPIDQHEVLALAWPRPMIIREGTNDSWNCPVCVYTTVKYTQMIYEALGAGDMIGFTHYNGGHCESGGSEWSTTYNAYVEKYMQGDASVSTAGMFTEGKFTFDQAEWQDGDLPPIP